MVLKPMATDAKEPTFSMGDDVPFAAVATRPRPMFNYLKQRFAQVTNPPIDHLRERLVMSLRTCLGPRRPLLTEEPGAARLLELPDLLPVPGGRRVAARPRPLPCSRRSVSTPRSRSPTVRAGSSAAHPNAGRRPPSRPSPPARRARDLRRAASAPSAAPIPSLLALGGGAPPARRRAHRVSRRRSSSTPATPATSHARRMPARLRRRRGVPAARARDGGEHGRRRPAGRAPLVGGAGEAPGRARGRRPEDLLEDGHLDRRRLPRRADLRGARARRRGRRDVPAVHGVRRSAASASTTLGADVLAPARRRVRRRRRPPLDEPGFVRFRKRGGEYHAQQPRRRRRAARLARARRPRATARTATASPRRRARSAGSSPASSRRRARTRARSSCSRARTPSRCRTPDPTDLRAAHLLQRAIEDGRADLYERFRELVESRPDDRAARPARARARRRRRSRSTRSSRSSAITRRFSTGAMSPRRAVGGGARDARDRDEHARRARATAARAARIRPATGPAAPSATATRASSRSRRAASG